MRNTFRTRFNLPLLATLILLAAVAHADTTPELNPTVVADSAKVAAPTTITAHDHLYDVGDAVDVRWELSIDDRPDNAAFLGYTLYRSIADSPFTKIADLPLGERSYKDEGLTNGATYRYRIDARSSSGAITIGPVSEFVIPDTEYINLNKANGLVFMIIVCGAVLYYINRAKKGGKVFISRIAGLEAVDEAIGRATEMGRPILFVPGVQDMDDVQTIAGMTILGKVATAVAQYETRAIVPTRASLVMTAAREIVKASYATAGRPDSYNEDNIFYLTDEQFGYVAGVNGIMAREKPATCFYLGAFFAESLILAENGNAIGAIQIAGTAQPAQLPFFVAACDYTLIGEELFAASAYLSGEPRQLGSLKGQDVGKVIALIAIVLGVLLVTLHDGLGVSAVGPIKDLLFKIFTQVGD